MTVKCMMALRDKVANLYTSPVCEPSVESAKRQIRVEIRSGDSMVAKHPEDFELWVVALYDTETGKLSPGPEFVCNLSSLVPVVPPEGRPVQELVEKLAADMDMRSRN